MAAVPCVVHASGRVLIVDPVLTVGSVSGRGTRRVDVFRLGELSAGLDVAFLGSARMRSGLTKMRCWWLWC